MRVTKAMLEETNGSLRDSIEILSRENFLYQEQLKHLKGIIDLYSRTPSLIIAAEKISDALAHTVDSVFRNAKR